MAPASLDLSLDEVIQASKGDKGSGKGNKAQGKRQDAPKEEETDMSLDELIEKDYLPPKGKGKGWSRDDWGQKPGGKGWEEKSKTTTGGGGGVASWKGWKDTSDEWKSKSFNDTWKVNDNWKAPVAWKKAETWGEKWGGGVAKKDWSGGWEDDWKPKPRGDDWSAKSTWNPRETAGKGAVWDKWSWAPKSTPWDAPTRQAWRPTNEQEREERWNGAAPRDAWDRRDDRGVDRYPRPDLARREGGYGEVYDVRDRRGARQRSRTPPRRNYFDDVPRGNEILVKNIPLGLDSRDIRDAFQSATGTVSSCKMSPDGTARITFDRPEDAKKAVATFDHGELNGRIIRVTITN